MVMVIVVISIHLRNGGCVFSIRMYGGLLRVHFRFRDYHRPPANRGVQKVLVSCSVPVWREWAYLVRTRSSHSGPKGLGPSYKTVVSERKIHQVR
jgi:hypothetical protein